MIVEGWGPEDSFVPRIDHSEWNPGEAEGTPPGFIYEDIMEFLMEIFSKSFRDSDSAELAEYNLGESRKIMI